MEFVEIQKLVFREYKKNGYLENWNKYPSEIGDLGEIGLFVTEVAEAMEVIRKGKESDFLAEELADLVIRVMNFSSRKGIDLEKSILDKHEVNMKRPKLHGKKL